MQKRNTFFPSIFISKTIQIVHKWTCWVVFLFPVFTFAQSKIVDDTTKQLYSAKTSPYVTESDLLFNKTISYPADTSLDNFHQYNFVEQTQYQFTDLGMIGTAMRPVFPALPATIGTRLGMESFDAYRFSPQRVKYYDTRSPYSRLYYVQGGRGIQVFQVEFSRNVNKRWNLGIDARNFSTQRLYGQIPGLNTGSFAARTHVHWSVVAKTRYFNKDSTYQILAHFSHLNHFSREQGGVKLEAPDNNIPENIPDLFEYQEALAQLEGTEARDFRNNWHVYQQYVAAKGFQVFHVFDREKRRNSYDDPQQRITNAAFYEPFLVPGLSIPDTLRYESNYQLFDNTLGLKGKFGKFDYRIFARNRTFTHQYNNTSFRRRGSENFLGIVLDYQFSNKADLHAEGEYQLFRDYRLEGTYRNKFLNLKYRRWVYAASIIQRQLNYEPFTWNAGFEPVFTDVISGNLDFTLKNLTLSPFAEITNFKNYIYFDKTARPVQNGSPAQLFQAGIKFKYRLKRFFTENEIVFSGVTGSTEYIQVPPIFANVRIYYQNILFKGATEVQIGGQIHYKSAFYGLAYMPVTSQFYLQDNFLLPAYPVIDVFANIRIKSVRLFIKFSQINQGFTAKGYLVAPYYFGLPRTLGFGVTWMFFD
jgi:hypothetical protein